MAGAFLPWEEWFARLIHAIAETINRTLYQLRRKWVLARSASWPQVKGAVDRVSWDDSYPREEIAYFYSTERGYYSGFVWMWFEPSDAQEVRAGDEIILRYDPDEHGKSVFVSLGW